MTRRANAQVDEPANLAEEKRLTVLESELSGASCRSSHVRNAPLATVGPKKAACRVMGQDRK